MRAVVVSGPDNYNLDDVYHPMPNDFLIGADQGALFLARQNIRFDIAIGDFDSVTETEKKLVDHMASKTITYPIKKDYTDTHLAILEARDRGYDEILLIGGIGGRFDHSYANVHLLTLGNVSIQTKSEFMYLLQPGEHDIENTHEYISLFAIDDVSDLTLKGFLYELDSIYLERGNPLGISNQGSGTICFTEGRLLVIHQNEMKKALK